jgi:hypothetical protein
MRILTITAITALALPFMALGQTTEPQQTQGQTNQPQTTAPTKGKKMKAAEHPGKPQAKPEAGTNVRGQPQPNVKGHAQEPTKVEPGVNKNEPGKTESGMRSGSSQTNVNQSTSVNQSTRVNVQEFKSRHAEVFSLGRHPKEFFVQRFGANHFRLIGNTYFAFVDGCWVAVDVDGFVYSERVICAGDPEFIEVE